MNRGRACAHRRALLLADTPFKDLGYDSLMVIEISFFLEESLKIERELERLTGDIERLKGRMRFLQDRIAYSTITVSFQPKEREHIDNQLFRLPFDWLDSLGLQRLLSL